MLSFNERLLFILLNIIAIVAAYNTFKDMFAIIGRGDKPLNFNELPQRVLRGIAALFTQGRLIRHRTLTSIFHYMIAYAFLFYFVVNAIDVLRAFWEFDWEPFGVVGGGYRLIADFLTVFGIVGTLYFLVRRFGLRDQALNIRDNVKLMEAPRLGISKDSLIVILFILFHLGFRFLGESFQIAAHGADAYQH